MDCQTTTYLEELSVGCNEKDSACQTDPAFGNRPVTPLFIPKPSGPSKFTQVMPGDLFNFDVEVEPMLEVLAGKTVDQALLEVLEEEELRALNSHQAIFESIRNAELAQCQRIEEAQRRRDNERKERIAEEKKSTEAKEAAALKLAAARAAKEYLAGLEQMAFSSLKKRGHMFDPLTRELETKIIPAIEKNTLEIKKREKAAKEIVETIETEVVDKRWMQLQAAVQKIREDEIAMENKIAHEKTLTDALESCRKKMVKVLKAVKEDEEKLKEEIKDVLEYTASTDNEEAEKEEPEPSEEDQAYAAAVAAFSDGETIFWQAVEGVINQLPSNPVDRLERLEVFLKGALHRLALRELSTWTAAEAAREPVEEMKQRLEAAFVELLNIENILIESGEDIYAAWEKENEELENKTNLNESIKKALNGEEPSVTKQTAMIQKFLKQKRLQAEKEAEEQVSAE